MSYYVWLPALAGGVNLFEDATSLPPNQLVQCDNFVPRGRRWQTIEGNTLFATSDAERINHLAEYQVNDSVTYGGTTKHFLMWTHPTTPTGNGKIYNIATGTPVLLTGPAINGGTLWDTAIFQGRLLMSSGTNNLLETSDASSYIATVTTGAPTAPQYVEAWKNRVFLAGVLGAGLSVYYSADGDRSTWTGTDAGVETVTTPVGDFITGIRSYQNYLAIFTRRTVTLLLGDHPDDWTKRTIYEDHGCSSHRTIARVNGGLIYANAEGVWGLSATGQRTELSRDIRPYWQNLGGASTRRNRARSANMHAVYDPSPNMNRYSIWIAEGSSTKEDVCWMLHLNSGEWTRMVSFMNSGQTCQASALREDSSGNVRVHLATGSDDTTTSDKKVYLVSSATSFASLTGGNIASTMKSGVLVGAHDAANKIVGLPSTKEWSNFYPKLTSTADVTNVTMNFDLLTVDASIQQASRTVPLQSATSSFVRPRVPVAKNGWGVQYTLTFTGQTAFDFIGGVFDYRELGDV